MSVLETVLIVIAVLVAAFLGLGVLFVIVMDILASMWKN